MVNEVAGLSLSVDSRQVRVAKGDLSGFATEARNAERAADRFGNQLTEADRAAGRFVDASGRMREANGRFVTGLGQTNTALSGATRGISTLSAAVSTLIAGLGVGQVLQYSDSWTNVQNQLRDVTSSSEDLARVTGRLDSVAENTRSSFAATANLYTRLSRASDDLGLSEERLLGVTTTINQAFALSGATATEAQNAIVQLSQGLAAGALRGDEFNSVAEQAPEILRAIAAELGITRGALREFAATGGISAELVVRSVENAADAIDQRFSQSTATFAQQAQIANDNLLEFLGTSSQVQGLSEAAGSALVALSENLDTIADVGQVLAIAAASYGAVTLAIRGATVATIAFNAASAANPLVLLARVAATAAVALGGYTIASDLASSSADELTESIRNNTSAVQGNAEATAESAVAAIESSIEATRAQIVQIEAANTAIELQVQAVIRQRDEFAQTTAEHIAYATAINAGVQSLDENRQQIESLNNLIEAQRQRLQQLAGASRTAASATNELTAAEREAAAIFNRTRTPLERYQIEVAQLGNLLRAGTISQDTYNRAVAQAEAILTDYNRAQIEAAEEGGVLNEILGTIAETVDNEAEALRRITDELREQQLATDDLAGAFANLGRAIGGSGDVVSAVSRLAETGIRAIEQGASFTEALGQAAPSLGAALGTAVGGGQDRRFTAQASQLAALVGFAIGGPLVGAAAGFITGALGIGPEPSDFAQAAGFELTTGAGFTAGQTGERFSQQNRDLADAAASQLSSFNAFLQQLTGDTVAGTIDLVVGSRDGLRVVVDGAITDVAQTTEQFLDLSQERLGILFDLNNAFYNGLADNAETFAQTVIRVEGQFDVLTQAARDFGFAFSAVGEEGRTLADQFAESLGGAQGLTSSLDFFFANVITEAQRSEIISNQALTRAGELNRTLGFTGDVLIDTRAELDAYIQTLDLTTESGREAASAVLQFADAVVTLEDSTRTAATDAFNQLQRSIAQEQQVLRTQFSTQSSAIREEISSLNSLSRSLSSTLSRLRFESDEFEAQSRQAAQNQIASIIQSVQAGGVLPEASDLSDSLQTLSRPSEDLFNNFVDYQRDFFRTRISIAELNELTDDQLSTEEQTLDTLQTGFDAEIARLDGIQSTAQQQLDAILGVDSSIQSVAAALSAFNTAASAGGQPGVTAGGQPVSGPSGSAEEQLVIQAYGSILGRQPDSAGLEFYTSALQNGALSAQDLFSAIRSGAVASGEIPMFQSGGLFGGGVRGVGERGFELEMTGPSRIINNADSNRILRALDSEPASRAQMDNMLAALVAISSNTRRQAQTLDNWDGDGLPAERTLG